MNRQRRTSKLWVETTSSWLRPLLASFLLFLTACEANSIRNREAGALGGGALGAGLGAIVGNQVGNTGGGIAIGSAIGALSGALIGNEIDNAEQGLSENDRRLEEQNRTIQENRRLIEELKGRGLEVHSSARGVVVNLPDVLFEFDSYRLTPQAERTAAEVARALKGMSERNISVEGHTDSIGTVDYNKTLSQNRAHSVADELARSGISRRRITVRGFGESDPIASNNTESGRSRNRRVEVIVEN